MELLMKRYRLIVVRLTLTFSRCFERNLLPPCFHFPKLPSRILLPGYLFPCDNPNPHEIITVSTKEKVQGNAKYKLSIFPQHPDIVSVYSHCCNPWGEILSNYKTNNENKILLKNKVFCCYWYCF